MVHNTECGKDVPLDENMTLLARTLHVRDNARGLTLNVSCYTVTNMPLHLRCKRESKSEQLVLQSMVEFLFWRGVDLSGLVNLVMDRGYWSAAILKYILSIGAEIHGTWKRQSIHGRTTGTIQLMKYRISTSHIISILMDLSVYSKRQQHIISVNHPTKIIILLLSYSEVG